MSDVTPAARPGAGLAEATARDAQLRDAQLRDGAFGGGYLIRSDRTGAPALVEGWPVHQFGRLSYHLHPRTVLATATATATASQPAQTQRRVIIIGTPVDVSAGSADGAEISQRVLQVWESGGVDAAVRHLAYLGGRWTAVLDPGTRTEGSGSDVTVVPDCQATQAVFYSDRAGITLGSQPALVAETVGADPDREADRLWKQLRAARRTGVVFLPGTLTTHEGVLPLVPNHLLRIQLRGAGSTQTASVAHERFWPFQERVQTTDTTAVAASFIEYFREHARLLARLGRPVVSLTGGRDSRTTLAAVLPHLREDSFTFTYYNPRDGLVGPGAPDDVFTANALSVAVSVPHRVIRWRRPEPGSVFADIYDRTYPTRRGSIGAAHAMWADLPHDIVHLQSIGAELGTTFYTHRKDVPITPARLLEIITHRDDLGTETAEAAFGDYLDYAQFSAATIGGYDYHDVFYWEQRMGKWGYQKYQDGDFSHRMLMPFNDRGLIELMQSLPYAEREGKVLLTALLATVPALAGTNPQGAAAPAPITWRDVIAARPHVRPRIARALARVPGARPAAGRMP